MLLETSFLAHTHILPTTLETFSFTLETSSLAHTHILHATLQMFFVAHADILLVSLYTSFLAFIHIIEATPHRHLF